MSLVFRVVRSCQSTLGGLFEPFWNGLELLLVPVNIRVVLSVLAIAACRDETLTIVSAPPPFEIARWSSTFPSSLAPRLPSYLPCSCSPFLWLSPSGAS